LAFMKKNAKLFYLISQQGPTRLALRCIEGIGKG